MCSLGRLGIKGAQWCFGAHRLRLAHSRLVCVYGHHTCSVPTHQPRRDAPDATPNTCTLEFSALTRCQPGISVQTISCRYEELQTACTWCESRTMRHGLLAEGTTALGVRPSACCRAA